MVFRATFDCLWCAQSHAVRGLDDLEGWAHLCPTCLGRAGDNGFLRMRLKTALAERATAHQSKASIAAWAAASDDWYLRRGRYSRGPVHDLAWQADLDAATVWLDRLPLRGEIVELAAGPGWWSPLLAQKGALSIYDAVEAPLERARARLTAHGLRAHIHVRDAWAEPDRRVDALFTGVWLGHVPLVRLGEFLRLAHRWLRPGGIYAFIEARPDPQSGAVEEAVVPDGEVSVRHGAGGPESAVPTVHYVPADLEAALVGAGFGDATVSTTSRFFLLGRATA